MDVSKYVKEKHETEAQLLALQDKYRVLLRLCHDAITEDEKNTWDRSTYLHYIEPGTWRRLVAAGSKPVQTGMFGKGEV